MYIYMYTYIYIYVWKLSGILPENIPRPLHSTLLCYLSCLIVSVSDSHHSHHDESTGCHTIPSVATFWLNGASPPFPPFPPSPFLLLSRGLVVHYTPAENQRGIIYSIYSFPLSFFHYVFPFVPFLLPSLIWLCLKSLCKVTSLSTVWNIFKHWAITFASAWKLRVSMERAWEQKHIQT